MKKTTPPRVTIAQLAYVAVFGVFVVIYFAKVIRGAATDLDWITLAASIVLLIVAAYRVLRSFSKPDA
ncbi:MAG: hypothetical protein ACK4TP_15185 [Hyphomicrobium sp.]|jgi:hypothetical protein